MVKKISLVAGREKDGRAQQPKYPQKVSALAGQDEIKQVLSFRSKETPAVLVHDERGVEIPLAGRSLLLHGPAG